MDRKNNFSSIGGMTNNGELDKSMTCFDHQRDKQIRRLMKRQIQNKKSLALCRERIRIDN